MCLHFTSLRGVFKDGSFEPGLIILFPYKRRIMSIIPCFSAGINDVIIFIFINGMSVEIETFLG